MGWGGVIYFLSAAMPVFQVGHHCSTLELRMMYSALLFSFLCYSSSMCAARGSLDIA